MKIHAQQLDKAGILYCQEIEPNTPDLLEIDGATVIAYMFDGEGFIEHNGGYYHMEYPLLTSAKNDGQIRTHINRQRFGGRLPDEDVITIDDLAICFGEITECSYEDFIVDFFSNLTTALKRHSAYPENDKHINKLLTELICKPPKHLYLMMDKDDIIDHYKLDGEIYAIGAEKFNEYHCDVLEQDILDLIEHKVVLDQTSIENSGHDYVLNGRNNLYKLMSNRAEFLIINHKPVMRSVSIGIEELAKLVHELPIGGKLNFHCDEDSNFWGVEKLMLFDGSVIACGSFGGGATSLLDIQIDNDELEVLSFLERSLLDDADKNVWIEATNFKIK